MTDDEMNKRWHDAVVDDVRARLVAMSDDEFVADTSFRIGTMTSDAVRRMFMNAVFVACEWHQMTRSSGVGVRDVFRVQKMMRDEFGFAVRR
jgi:hypothetical protein